jgi:solute carrier family 25 (mitochondrial folate transporter), member 32
MSAESIRPLIAGFTGGLVSTSLLLPIDVIKVRLQVDEASGSRKRRLSFVRAMQGILKYEGMQGLWVGWTPAVIGSAVSWGGYFYFYEGFKRKLVDYKLRSKRVPADSPQPRNPSDVLNSFDNFVLACTAGGVMVVITNPIWLVKTRMQLQMKRASQQHNIKPYKNTIDSFRTIVREEGPLALYKGASPALFLTSHGGVQFVVYEYLKKHFHYVTAKRDEARKSRSVWEKLEKSTGYLTIGAVAKM